MADRLGEEGWTDPAVLDALGGWCGDLSRDAEEIADELCNVHSLTLDALLNEVTS